MHLYMGFCVLQELRASSVISCVANAGLCYALLMSSSAVVLLSDLASYQQASFQAHVDSSMFLLDLL